MGRRRKSSSLNLFMNGEAVGRLNRLSSGKLELLYADEWINSAVGRSISLSIPIVLKQHTGDAVENYFDNLLPDSMPIRNRIQARFGIAKGDSFDLLAVIGKDCIGALQMLPEGIETDDFHRVVAEPLTDSIIAEILKNYRSMPLGMNDEDDFRISIAGAQEKTAFLFHKGQWCRPSGSTPTSHIFKLPIGRIEHNNIDLSDSAENEWLCHLLLKEFGLPVANAEIKEFADMKALVVERFDRKWSEDGSWLIRLPQEDICQAMGISPAIKYESSGGAGIESIMKLLLGSTNSIEDRRIFMKAVFVFWLLGATDGHAKNFSIFLEQGGRFRLTPLYDVMSVYPLVAKKQLSLQKVKMAMSVSGKSKHYRWAEIQQRHWLATAKLCSFPEKEMKTIMDEVIGSVDKAVSNVEAQLPPFFPDSVSEPMFSMLKKVTEKLG